MNNISLSLLGMLEAAQGTHIAASVHAHGLVLEYRYNMQIIISIVSTLPPLMITELLTRHLITIGTPSCSNAGTVNQLRDLPSQAL